MAQVDATDHFRFPDSASDHVALVPSLNVSFAPPMAQHPQNQYAFMRVDIFSLKYQLSSINWHELLCECPTIDTMFATFMDTFFSTCSQCVPISSGPKRKSTHYPMHIVKLRTKCKRLSKCKRLPNGMYNIIFKISLDSGICPSFWKSADITIVYKKGDALQVYSYSPITILPAMCCLFECILADNINYHLYQNHLITDAQYGFVKGRYTELQ